MTLMAAMRSYKRLCKVASAITKAKQSDARRVFHAARSMALILTRGTSIGSVVMDTLTIIEKRISRGVQTAPVPVNWASRRLHR